jgi:NIMA-interacting peptidyl-prolyl cis-trans isomerase 1
LIKFSRRRERARGEIANCRAMSVRASHILIKHKQSRRPASWRDENGDEIKRREKSTATAQLKEIHSKLATSSNLAKDFGDIAKTTSDCSSAKQAGDLGVFERGQMQKPVRRRRDC